MKHLFSLCENKSGNPVVAVPTAVNEEDEDGATAAVPASAAASTTVDASLALVRATTAAALSKELLKLGNSKLEKAIDKEFVKILASLSFESWIDYYDVSGLT